MGEWKRRDGSPLVFTQSQKLGREGKGHTGVIIEELGPVISEDQEHGTVCGNQLVSNHSSREQDPHLHPMAIKKAMKNEA